MAVCAKACRRTYPRTVLSILVDRILGLLGLFVVALATLPFVWSDIQRAAPNVKALVAFVVLVAIVGGSVVTLVLTRDFWMPAGSKDKPQSRQPEQRSCQDSQGFPTRRK